MGDSGMWFDDPADTTEATELEYYHAIADQAEAANPPGVVADFVAWVRDPGSDPTSRGTTSVAVCMLRSSAARAPRAGRQRLPDGNRGECPVDGVDIEGLRVVPARPLDHVLVIGVLRIGQGLQQVLVAHHAATVFGRRSTGAIETKHNTRAAIRQQQLQCDGVRPRVAEVVLVADPVLGLPKHMLQADPVVVDSATPAPKGMEVAILPAESDLHDPMQVVDVEAGRQLDTTPDRWLDVVELSV
jgi:hypothetical protein